VSNVLVVPLVPLGMLLSLIAGLAGTLIPTVAGFVALPASILLTYILDIIYLLSRVPHALIQLGMPLGPMVMLYALLLFLSFVLWQKTGKNGTVTEIETEDLYAE
jgi:hypothetical protein